MGLQREKYSDFIFKIGTLLGLAILLFANFGLLPQAFATTYMTHASLWETNMNSSGSGQVYLAFTAGASDSAGSLTIAMGTGVSSVASSITASSASCTALTGASTGLPGTLASSTGSGTTFTINNVNALTASTSYCVQISTAAAYTNTATPGNYTATITDASDTTKVGYDVISNDTVVVSADVPPSFTLNTTGNVDSFTGNLNNSSTTSTTGTTWTVITNANSGWSLWAMDTNAGLHSPSESKTIASAATGANYAFGSHTNAENYGLGVTGVTTSGSATANYTDSGTSGSGLSNTVYNEISSGTVATTGSATTIKELANVSGTTPAAQDYTDTVSIVGAGSF